MELSLENNIVYEEINNLVLCFNSFLENCDNNINSQLINDLINKTKQTKEKLINFNEKMDMKVNNDEKIDITPSINNRIALYTANIIWFDIKKGFGFVSVHPFNREVFFHSSIVDTTNNDDILSNLYRGREVFVDINLTTRGYEVNYLLSTKAKINKANDLNESKSCELRELIESLRSELIDPQKFDVTSKEIISIANKMPRNHNLIRNSFYFCIQDVNRSLNFKAHLFPNLLEQIKSFYEIILNGKYCFSANQIKAIEEMNNSLQQLNEISSFSNSDDKLLVNEESKDNNSLNENFNNQINNNNKELQIEYILSNRIGNIILILENVSNLQNIFAIFRTVEAIGIQHVYLITTNRFKYSNISLKHISKNSHQFLSVRTFSSVFECINALNNIPIYVTVCNEDSVTIQQCIPFPSEFAIVIGCEANGVSEEMIHCAKGKIKLEMFGFVESFNVTVATALILQKIIDNCSNCRGTLNEETKCILRNKWINKTDENEFDINN